jgi:CBS domain containing-hemolysin-like protein
MRLCLCGDVPELVPKNLALRNSEAIVCAVAPPIAALSRIAPPAVWVLDASIRALFRLVRYKPRQQSSVMEAEIKAFEGIVTPADVLEAIAGAFHSDTYREEPQAVRREDGSWLLAGRMPAGELADQLGIMLAVDRYYRTRLCAVTLATPACGRRAR